MHRSLSVLAALWLVALPAQAVKVRVIGGTTLEARVVRAPPGADIVGVLRDDAGRGVGAAAVRLELAEGGASALSACGRGAASPVAAGSAPGTWVVTTDAGGRFCARSARPLEGRVVLRHDGDALRAGSERALEAGQASPVALSFSPEPAALPLERERHTVWVESRLDPLTSPSDEALALEAVLFEPGATEGRVVGRGGGRIGERVSVELGGELGDPGPARLVVRVVPGPGAASAAGARPGPSVEAPVLRTARVTLALVGGAPRGDPMEGIVIPVAASWGRGAVPSGSVEAVLGRDSVGTVGVQEGTARVVASFQAARPGELSLTASYLPVSPWWVATEPLVVGVTVEPPSRWKQWPWWALAGAVGAWLYLSWRRPGPALLPSEKPLAPRSGKAGLVFLDEPAPAPGWRGQVVDAHDGTPLVGVRIALTIPSFDPSGAEPASALTDADGRFELPPLASPSTEGARLEASGPWHARLVRPVPRQGTVRVQLVTRRRALLVRLVDWSRHQLARAPQEPTPGQVARLASEQGQAGAAAWARAVEGAAFGPGAVGEAREAEVLALEPRPAAPESAPAAGEGRR